MSTSQQFLFVEYRTGQAKQSGRPYSFVVLSDGLSAFNVSTVPDFDVDQVKSLTKGEQVNVEFDHVVRYGKIEPVIRSIS